MDKPIFLLINPWIYDFAAFDFWARPLGLLYAGSLLRAAGAEVRLIDCLDAFHPAMAEAGLIHRRRDALGRGKFTCEPAPLAFHAASGMHVRGIDDDLARLLKKAGFATIRLGLETHWDDRRPDGDRKATSAELAGAVSALAKAGYRPEEIGVYLLAGLPGQDAAELEQSVDFVLSLGARPRLTEYSPIPGSAMWEKAKAHSRFDLEADPLTHDNSVFPCVSDSVDRRRIVSLRNRLRSLYRR